MVPLPRYNAEVPPYMANRAYLRVWTRDFSEELMIAEFARFLASAPLSASMNTFAELTVQPVDATETPVASWDLRAPGIWAGGGCGAVAAALEYGQRVYCHREVGLVGAERGEFEVAARTAALGAHLQWNGLRQRSGRDRRALRCGPGIRTFFYRACRFAGSGQSHQSV